MSRERTAALAGVLYVALDVVVGNIEGVRTFSTLAAVFLSAAGFGLAAHLVATNILARRSQMLGSWLVVVGIVSAVAFLTSAVLGALRTNATSNMISLVGFVLWLAWILGVSYSMDDRAPRDQVVGESSAPPGPLKRGRT
jgi:hypothetical protein